MVGGRMVVEDLGLIEYREAWRRQKELAEGLKAAGAGAGPSATGGDEATLLLLEHPHVYTLGRRAREGLNVLDPGEVPVLEVERGGDVTYHGPGQLVAYPILKLSRPWQEVRRYILALEQAVIHTVARWGVTAGLRYREVGVWLVMDRKGRMRQLPSMEAQRSHWQEWQGTTIDRSTTPACDSATLTRGAPPGPPPHASSARRASTDPVRSELLPEGCRWRKLASVGVAISKWVTCHGLALNVDPDLSYFARINPCGFEAGVMTSMAQVLGERAAGQAGRNTGERVGVEDVKPVLAEALAREFGMELVLPS